MDLLELLISVDAWFMRIDQSVLNKIFCLILAVTAVINRNNKNTLLLVSLILGMKLFDILWLNDFLLNNPHFKVGYKFFVVYGIYDLVVLFLIAFRVQAFKRLAIFYFKIVKCFLSDVSDVKTASFFYQRHIDEFKVMGIFLFSFIFNMVAAGEYALTTPGDKSTLYIYYSYTPIKVSINAYQMWLIIKIGFQSMSAAQQQGIK